jgi:hypothetical protein
MLPKTGQECEKMKKPMCNAVYITAILFAVVAVSVMGSGCLQTPQGNPNINVNIMTTPTPAQEKIVDIVVNGQHIHVDTEGDNKTVHIDEPDQAPIDVNVKVNNSIRT